MLPFYEAAMLLVSSLPNSTYPHAGRLSETKTALGKDEMLSIIRHGANEVFKSKDAEITDEDIDTIMAKGEAKVCNLEIFLCFQLYIIESDDSSAN